MRKRRFRVPSTGMRSRKRSTPGPARRLDAPQTRAPTDAGRKRPGRNSQSELRDDFRPLVDFGVSGAHGSMGFGRQRFLPPRRRNAADIPAPGSDGRVVHKFPTPYRTRGKSSLAVARPNAPRDQAAQKRIYTHLTGGRGRFGGNRDAARQIESTAHHPLVTFCDAEQKRKNNGMSTANALISRWDLPFVPPRIPVAESK